MWGQALGCKNNLEDKEESSDSIFLAQAEILKCLHRPGHSLWLFGLIQGTLETTTRERPREGE